MFYLKEKNYFLLKLFLSYFLVLLNTSINIFFNGKSFFLYFKEDFFYYQFFEYINFLNYFFYYNFLKFIFFLNYIFGFSFIIFLIFSFYFIKNEEYFKAFILFFHLLMIEFWFAYFDYLGGITLFFHAYLRSFLLPIAILLFFFSFILLYIFYFDISNSFSFFSVLNFKEEKKQKEVFPKEYSNNDIPNNEAKNDESSNSAQNGCINDQFADDHKIQQIKDDEVIILPEYQKDLSNITHDLFNITNDCIEQESCEKNNEFIAKDAYKNEGFDSSSCLNSKEVGLKDCGVVPKDIDGSISQTERYKASIENFCTKDIPKNFNYEVVNEIDVLDCGSPNNQFVKTHFDSDSDEMESDSSFCFEGGNATQDFDSLKSYDMPKDNEINVEDFYEKEFDSSSIFEQSGNEIDIENYYVKEDCNGSTSYFCDSNDDKKSDSSFFGKRINEIDEQNFFYEKEDLIGATSSYDQINRQDFEQKKHEYDKCLIKKSYKNYILPNCNLLNIGEKIKIKIDIESQKKLLIETLADFGVPIFVKDVFIGPVVTLYSISLAAGIKASKIINLCDDIARLMLAFSVRIATIPGKNLLGVEISNYAREIVYFKEGVLSKSYKRFSGNLPLYLGCNIYGHHEIFDLSYMPHLLVAGTTGSGKSVAIHTMLLSLLLKKNAHEVKLILIDPKKLELTPYEDIPHLLFPVITEANKAIYAVKWAVEEMERRYIAMSKIGVRNIFNYNKKVENVANIDKKLLQKFHYIVIVVDEMADLMLMVGKDFEMYIQRLAQMGRAAGIHMIVATQRPSVDVITGTIKANFPTRISFKLSSKIDSRTILGDSSGAEQLLGAGDMLYFGNNGKITRIHGSFVTEEEVYNVVSFLKQQSKPEYIELSSEKINDFDFEDDIYYKEAVELIKAQKKVSVSFLQRYFTIGYNRAAKIIEKMEKQGIISKGDKFGRNREIIK